MGNNLGTNDIIDITLKTSKKKIRLNGDDNRILEIDLSDMYVINRLNEAYPKLLECIDAIKDLGDMPTPNYETGEIVKDTRLADCDNKMRAIIDEIFDANVSEVFAPSGSMYDPVGGQFRFEAILDTLGSLYGDNLQKEFNAMKKNVNTKVSNTKRKRG